MSVHVKVVCPGSVVNHQGTRVLLAGGWWSAKLHFPVGITELDLDEKTLAALQGEAARGESPLKVEVVSAEAAAKAKADAEAAELARMEAEEQAAIEAEAAAKAKAKGKR